MEFLQIKGGTPLTGEVHAAGAKNAMTKLLVASLISDKRCTFFNVPDIMDVEITVQLCQELGAEVHWNKKEKVLEIVTKELKTSYIPQRYSASNRIPILMMGALLGRTEEDIIIPTLGGCEIGSRAVNFHVHALEKLGATIEFRVMKKEAAYFAHAHNGLKGAIIELDYPSVGATENSILAAVSAKGTTIIKNAATEPEIIDLILFLQKLGAHITVDVDRTIHIQGTKKFYDVEHTCIPDRIEAASFGMAAIATKGRVFVRGAQHRDMITFLNKLREIGGGFSVRNEGIEFFYDGGLKGSLHLETDVHPGFMTDWQPPFVALLTQANGSSVVHETVYENRFGFTSQLKEMGADISLFKQCLGGKTCRFTSCAFSHSIVVKGPTPLSGKTIHIPDLRAGFAYVMAALISKDESKLTGLKFLDRGYENLVAKLTGLGANLERHQDEQVESGLKLIAVQ